MFSPLPLLLWHDHHGGLSMKNCSFLSFPFPSSYIHHGGHSCGYACFCCCLGWYMYWYISIFACVCWIWEMPSANLLCGHLNIDIEAYQLLCVEGYGYTVEPRYNSGYTVESRYNKPAGAIRMASSEQNLHRKINKCLKHVCSGHIWISLNIKPNFIMKEFVLSSIWD